jgi:esterase/lipase
LPPWSRTSTASSGTSADCYAIAANQIAVIGQSVGAVLAATWAHDYAPQIRCLVLTAPAFQVKLYVPLARPGLTLMQRLFGNFFITSYVKAKFLTHDPERVRSYDEDPLVTRAISARVLLGLYDAADRVVADAEAIRLPLQLLISEKDWVVQRAPQDRFFDRLGSPVKERHLLPGFLHDTLGERDRKLAIDQIRAFIERMFRESPACRLAAAGASQTAIPGTRKFVSASRYRPARHAGFTSPSPAWRCALSAASRTASGIGLTTGFDSGSSLDYVYLNQARGRLLIGK